MSPEQRNEIRGLAKSNKKEDLEAAACEWLGLKVEWKAAGNKVPADNTGAVHAIVTELETYEKIDAEKSKAATAGGGKSDDGGSE